jgi:hypothetical protein
MILEGFVKIVWCNLASVDAFYCLSLHLPSWILGEYNFLRLPKGSISALYCLSSHPLGWILPGRVKLLEATEGFL